MLSSNTSSTCPYSIVNFGPLVAAEIVSLVWGTPGNFNGYSLQFFSWGGNDDDMGDLYALRHSLRDFVQTNII